MEIFVKGLVGKGHDELLGLLENYSKRWKRGDHSFRLREKMKILNLKIMKMEIKKMKGCKNGLQNYRIISKRNG